MNLDCPECSHPVRDHGGWGCGTCRCNLTDNGAFARAVEQRREQEGQP